MASEFLSKITNLPWLYETIRIIIYFLVAWVVSLISNRIAHRFMRLGRLAPLSRRNVQNARKPSKV